MTALLSVNNLSVSFGTIQAVKDISFDIAKGEMLAVVGESGSGKSMSALACLGLQPPSATVSGVITLGDATLLRHESAVARSSPEHASCDFQQKISEADFMKIRGKRIGMIFQEPMTALNPLHTIGKQIGEILVQHSPARVLELLEQVGLTHFKDRLNAYPHQLSGGERQRVMIAMAIANNPDLLIADEPTTAVDVTIQAKILTLLKELQAQLGMSILFITHDLTIVRKMADRVAVMQAGELVEIGTVADVFAAPKHPYTKHLLASEPKGTPEPVAADAKEAVACDHLKVYFPIKTGLLRKITGYVKAVDDISISVTESSTLGIAGESGSGKSTLGFALLRLQESEGRIVFMGQDISQLPAKALRGLRKEMQLVFQDPYSSLNPRMSVRQIIEEALALHFPAKSAAEREADIDAILKEVGLDPAMKDRYPHEFSGGQRQRISIARAMVLKPKFVVLDEPTSALDLSVQSQIIELLRDLQKRYGLTYIFISHDLRVMRAIAHNILILHKGKVVEYGTTSAIFSAPKHDYTKTLIEAAMLNG